ncbi:MAG: hypothetical protein J6P53_05755 [Mailhella sp.]|nr:hypothetical protein [Mailhella sp.]
MDDPVAALAPQNCAERLERAGFTPAQARELTALIAETAQARRDAAMGLRAIELKIMALRFAGILCAGGAILAAVLLMR